MTAVARNGAAESRSFGFNWSGFVLNLYLGVFFLYLFILVTMFVFRVGIRDIAK